jgi:hypothetical protein
MCLDKIRGVIDNIHFVPPVKNFYYYITTNTTVFTVKKDCKKSSFSSHSTCEANLTEHKSAQLDV